MDRFELLGEEGFLGTSIQFAEQELLLLEREHEQQKERDVRELIESGFLDSDWEEEDDEDDEEEQEEPLQEPSDPCVEQMINNEDDAGEEEETEEEQIETLVVVEELPSDYESLTGFTAQAAQLTERLFDSLRDNRYQIRVQEQIVVVIDYSFYGIYDEHHHFDQLDDDCQVWRAFEHQSKQQPQLQPLIAVY